jgi:Kdo-III transferase WaaZ
MGTLAKQIYRYTHPRSMRHNENLWPFVKIKRDEYDAISSLTYKSVNIPLANLSLLKNQYSGEVLLLATGPSIKDIDFSSFPSYPTVGVNGAWYLDKILSFGIYIIVDMTFIDKKPDILKEIISRPNLILFTTVHGVVKLVQMFSAQHILCDVCVIEDKCYQTYKPRVKNNDINKLYSKRNNVSFFNDNKKIAFNHDIRSGVFDAGTVVYWSLQILAYLGFNKIYIAGLDMSNFSTPRFYETSDNMLPSFLEDKVNDLIIPAFHLASIELKKRNIEVVNLSPNSAIPDYIFKKMDYRDAFN